MTTDKPETQPNCSICQLPIPVVRGWAGGNNAEPINAGRCCDHCNATVVLPARIKRITQGKSAR